jgi:hypothetical protein
MRIVTGFLRFWWDFIVGDDWRVAAGVAVVLGGGAVLVAETGASDSLVAALMAIGTALVAIGTIAASALSVRRDSTRAAGRARR